MPRLIKNILKLSWCVLLLVALASIPLGCALIPAPVVTPPVKQAAGEQVREETVLTHRLHLRAQPSSTSQVLGVLNRDESVRVKDMKITWVEVVTKNGKKGWVYAPGHLTGFADPGEPKQSQLERSRDSGKEEAVSAARVESKTAETANGDDRRATVPFPDRVVHKEDTSGSIKPPLKYLEQTAKPDSGEQPIISSNDDEVVFVEMIPSADFLAGNDDDESKTDAAVAPDISGNTGSAKDTSASRVIVVKADTEAVIRSSPDSTATILAEAKPGTKYVNYGREGEWYKVKIDDRFGFIQERTVEETH
jgi:SH3-like domain-containing protein